jgi:DNA-binding SARP family transcriptional activator
LEIRTLGGFQVLRAGHAPISEREWAGSRPRLLFKAILVHGGRDVPRDVLIEDLWPESRPKAAEQNFKVTLHRLRKVLEPDLDRDLGSAYIHLREHRVSLDRDLCRTDVESFLAVCKKIRRIEATAGTDELLILCRRARDLYAGDFLPEESYTPWVETKRALLSETYAEVLERMTRLYQRRDMLAEATDCCRALTRAAPCHDRAHRRLMELYAAQGMRSAALQVYDKFHTTLQSELGVAPDADTRAVYLRLRSEC